MTSGNDSAPQPSSPSGTTRAVAAPSPEAVLEALVDRTPHALAYLDREFNFVHVNAAYAESSHRPLVELIGRNHFELYPHAENEAIFRRVRDTGETAIWREKPFVFPDQPERGVTYWDWTLSPVRDATGDVTGLVFSLVEVTEAVRARQRIAESEERFRRLVEVSAQVVWVADAAGRPRDGSPSRGSSGKPDQAGVGWSWLDAIHPDDRERVWRCWQQALASRSDYEVAFRTQDAEGGYRQVVARAVPLLAEDGSVREWIGMNTDVSERERALERLRRSEAVLAEAERMAHLGAWWTDAHSFGELVADASCRWSKEVYRILGYEPSERAVTSGTYFAHVPPEERELVLGAMREALGAQAPFSMEHRIVRRSGELRHVVEHARLEFDRDGRPCGIVGAIQDVTEQKRIEAALRGTDRQKTEFLAMLSHELRNPLAPIRNSLYVLDLTPPDSHQAQRARAVIRRQVDQLVHLVDELLDMTRIVRGKIELDVQTVDLAELLRCTAEDHRSLFDARGVTLTLALGDEPMVIDGDSARLRQAVGNLLHNASKFTLSGGTTRLSLSVEPSGKALVTVADDGVGFAPEMARDLFEPFTQKHTTIDRAGGGLGLGLALVRAVAELHGGSVDAMSGGLGSGASFLLRLPLPRTRAGA